MNTWTSQCFKNEVKSRNHENSGYSAIQSNFRNSSFFIRKMLLAKSNFCSLFNLFSNHGNVYNCVSAISGNSWKISVYVKAQYKNKSKNCKSIEIGLLKTFRNVSYLLRISSEIGKQKTTENIVSNEWSILSSVCIHGNLTSIPQLCMVWKLRNKKKNEHVIAKICKKDIWYARLLEHKVKGGNVLRKWNALFRQFVFTQHWYRHW